MKLPEESMEVSTEEGQRERGGFRKPNKRKAGKKSRLLQKARRNAKQGRLGRGFEVDSTTYHYFLQVLELWQKNEFQNEEERAIFVENSFAQTISHEVDYSSNQMTSRVIETLLPAVSEEVLLRFGAAFAPSLRTLVSDPFASHVVEKLCEVASSTKWGSSGKVTEWFRSTASYVLNNLEEFTFDPYANHVMRKVCQCLTGFVQETGQGTNQPHSSKPPRKSATSETSVFGERPQNPKNVEIFINFYQRLIAWPQFYDLFQSELTSCLVQTVLKSAARVDNSRLSLEEGISRVCEALGPSLDLSNATHASLYTRMLEVCLPLSGPSWSSIFKKYFSGRCSTFGVHEKGKFSLKKVIETCPSKEDFETVFDEIQPAFGDIYKAESTSIFSSVAEACKKWGTRQAQFIQSLTDLLEGGSEENFISKLAIFGGKLELKEDGTPKYITQFVGTMIIQNLMEFHKPLKVISSMMEMEGSNLAKLATDPKGSHIFHAFFKSGTIGEKNKEKMLKMLKEYMVSFAINKFGSRIIDTIWDWGSLKHKSILASSLCERVALLSGNQFGKFIAEKMSLHIFKRDSKLWAESLEKGQKRQKEAEDVLEEFLGGGGEEIKKKKKKAVMEENVDVQLAEDVEEGGRKKKKSKKNRVKVEAEEEQVMIKAEPEEEEQVVIKAEPEEEEQVVIKAEPEEEEAVVPKKKKKRKHSDTEKSESSVPDSTTTEETAEVDDEEVVKKKKKKSKK